jgi:hypothetical protein
MPWGAARGQQGKELLMRQTWHGLALAGFAAAALVAGARAQGVTPKRSGILNLCSRC